MLSHMLLEELQNHIIIFHEVQLEILLGIRVVSGQRLGLLFS